jgi:hypothetical protein
VRFKSEQKHEKSVTDPDPGSGAFLTPGLGMNILVHNSESFWVKNTVRFKMQGLIIINKVYQVFQILPESSHSY